MAKVAMIGAGSVVFSKNLTADILRNPELKGSTITYMDVDKERLDVAAAIGRKVAATWDPSATIEATMNRRKALAGADFVICMINVGGFDSTLVDFTIPRKYGLDFTIGDTTGPGGIFRALRTFPALRLLCRDMEAVCPGALLLNYTNPMSMNMQTVFRTSSINAVGLCHSVQGTLGRLLEYLGEKQDEVSFVVAGINHMAFFLELKRNGVDLYPRLFKAMRDPQVYATNKVRFELMRRFGFFPTESSDHHAEYSSFFIPHGKEVIARYDVPMGEYLWICDTVLGLFGDLKKLSTSKQAPKVPLKSDEYASTIIHSIVSGKPSVVYGNLLNTGAIGNLPKTAIVEAPTLVDGTGLRHGMVGELPPQLVGYMSPHIAQHELFIRGAMEGRRDYIYQAAMYDPLTSATLPPDKIVEMCDEMIAAHGKLLPALTSKRRVPSSGRKFVPPRPGELRAAWDVMARELLSKSVKRWHVLGPFPSPEKDRVTLKAVTSVEKAMSDAGGLNRKTSFQAGRHALRWRSVDAADNGCVRAVPVADGADYCVLYGYAEIDCDTPCDRVLLCGSDDDIRVWLNAKLVHHHETQRDVRVVFDAVPVRLRAGVNRLLVKTIKRKNGGGFRIIVSDTEQTSLHPWTTISDRQACARAKCSD